MRSPSSLAPLTAGLLASMLAVACSSSTEPSAGDDGVAAPAPGDDGAVAEGPAESSEDELRASCANPRRYFVTYRDGAGTCEPIAGRRGQWLPERLFADAPPEIQASTCAYRWSGERYSRPDRDAIVAKVGETSGLAPACGSSSFPDVGLLEPIPYIDIWSQAGSVGCDVCGVLRHGKLWVVLPPEKIARKQFEVQLTNGTTRAFQIEATDARALSIALPNPPRGTAYKQGRVHIY